MERVSISARRGSVTLAGTLASPTLEGSIASTGGTLTYFDRAFRVQQGTFGLMLPTGSCRRCTRSPAPASSIPTRPGAQSLRQCGDHDQRRWADQGPEDRPSDESGRLHRDQILAMIAPFGGFIGGIAFNSQGMLARQFPAASRRWERSPRFPTSRFRTNSSITVGRKPSIFSTRSSRPDCSRRSRPAWSGPRALERQPHAGILRKRRIHGDSAAGQSRERRLRDTFGLPQIQSFGLIVQSGPYTTETLSFFYQSGPTKLSSCRARSRLRGGLFAASRCSEPAASASLYSDISGERASIKRAFRLPPRGQDPGEGGRNRTRRVENVHHTTFDPGPRSACRPTDPGRSFSLSSRSFNSVITPALSAPAPRIVSVDVTGNLHVPTATIMAVIAGAPGDSLRSQRSVQEDLARINALGYFADIAPPLVRERPGGIAITYRVVENPVITKIVFTGNQKVPSDTLLALMDLSVGQVFNTNTFRQDVLKINNYYERIGYGGQVPTHVKDHQPRSEERRPDARRSKRASSSRTIIIGGDPLAASAADPAGVDAQSPERSTPTKCAMPTTRRSRNSTKTSITSSSETSRAASIPRRSTSRPEPPTSSTNLRRAHRGRRGTGNTRTKDQVIRRVLRELPGMVLNTDAVKRDYERLNALGYFSKVEPDVKPGPDPKKPQDVTLVWHVTEQRTARLRSDSVTRAD